MVWKYHPSSVYTRYSNFDNSVVVTFLKNGVVLGSLGRRNISVGQITCGGCQGPSKKLLRRGIKL